MVVNNFVSDKSQFESVLSPSCSCVFLNGGLYYFIVVVMNNMVIFSYNLSQSYLFFQASYWTYIFILEDVRKFTIPNIN